MADTGEHGEKALDGKSCRRLARETLAALTTAPTAPVDREVIANAITANIRLEWRGHDDASINPRSVTAAADAIASLLPTPLSVGEGDPA